MKRLIVAAFLTLLGCTVAEAQDIWLCVTPSTWCEMGPGMLGVPCPCAGETGVTVTVDEEGYFDEYTESTEGDVCYTSAGQCFTAPTGIGYECQCGGFPGIVGIR